MALILENETVFLNDIDRDSYIKTVTDMCMILAQNVAERDNRSVNDVLADAYLDSGRDLWHETFNAVVRNLTQRQ